MGIRLLNRYLKNSPCQRIRNVSFQHLKNKKIAVDIYNYIYRFLGNNRLLEELDILCKILHKYNIRTLFFGHLEHPPISRAAKTATLTVPMNLVNALVFNYIYGAQNTWAPNNLVWTFLLPD